jgi:NADH-quinone oxidoreductase subunit G
VIKAEKCPNRRGVERIIEHFGSASMTWEDFVAAATGGKFHAAYITGGYPESWISPQAAENLRKIETVIVHDLFPGPLDDRAAMLLPQASWAEREGVWMNCDGLVQRFERSIPPLDGVKADGQFFLELAGERGLFRSTKVCAMMGEEIPEFADVFEPREVPKHAH